MDTETKIPRSLVPPPSHFVENSNNNIQAATNKSKSLAAVIQHGGLREAIKAGKIDYATLGRYLADPEYATRLKEIETSLCGLLVAKATEKALDGNERMLEFVIPALDPRFDSGIRRQQVANRGAIDSLLMSKALEDSTVEIDPLAVSMPDNLSYQASDMSRTTHGLDGSGGGSETEAIDLNVQESPTINKDEK